MYLIALWAASTSAGPSALPAITYKSTAEMT